MLVLSANYITLTFQIVVHIRLFIFRKSAALYDLIIIIIIIIIYTTYIAPYIWPVWPFIGAEEGPSKY